MGKKVLVVGGVAGGASAAERLRRLYEEAEIIMFERGEYKAIVEKFGDVAPFNNIVNAEEQHVQSLMGLYDTYGYAVPEDTSAEQIVVPETFNDSLKGGIAGEIDNIAMYEKFLAQPNLPNDMQTVFTQLRDASKNHLAAFEKSVQ